MSSTLSSFSIAELQNRASQRGLTVEQYLQTLFAMEQSLQPVALYGSQLELQELLASFGCKAPLSAKEYSSMPLLTLSSNTLSAGFISQAIRLLMMAAECNEFSYQLKGFGGSAEVYNVNLNNKRSVDTLANQLMQGRLGGSFLAIARRF